MPDERPEGAAPSIIGGVATSKLIEAALALGLVGLLLWGVLMVLAPFVMAILFGAFIAVGTWPMRDALVARGFRPSRAALLLFVGLVLVVAVPIVLIAPALPAQIGAAVELARTTIENVPDVPPDWVTGLPVVGDHAGRLWTRLIDARNDFGAFIAPYSTQLGRLLISIGTGAAESVVQVVLALVVTAMFWINGDQLAAVLRESFGRIGGPAGAAAVDAAGGAVRGVAWGIVGTAALQAALMGVGLAIARVPGAAMLGFLAFVFSVSQILGLLILPIWMGAAWWHINNGRTGWAIFVVGVGILVGIADNIVRPLLISRGSAMPMTLIILGVFGGLIAFGFLGLFIGPALLAVGYGLLRAWRGEADRQPPAA